MSERQPVQLPKVLGPHQMPDALEHVMRADVYRLRKSWRQLRSIDDSHDPRLQKWYARVEASAALRQLRQTRIPDLQFDDELPITAHREQIVQLIRSRQTIIVCGETGSGKSTQLPKFCLQAGLGVAGLIGHTQPRRLAARAVSARVADELSSRVGELVGFKIRFADATGPETLVKLMTDGVLLAETQSDRFLNQYDAIIVDEAHERSLNIDFLLGYLRQLIDRRPDLRLIITSATIDPQRFAEHFADAEGPAPIVEVSGRTFPVEIRYRPLTEAEDSTPAEEQLLLAISAGVDELMSEGPPAGQGDILIFLPTERDIRAATKHLRGHFTRLGRQVDLLPLYARLSQAEQNKIFAPHAGRRIVLATNVAESSLTVPGIRYVIDSGLVRMSRYAPKSKVQRLPIEGVSQASANQRAGRCGRLGPGICIRLFSEPDFATRARYTTPEIRRSDLASVLLQSKTLQLGPLSEFPLLDPPGPEALRDAQRTLRELGAVDAREELTEIGRQLGKLPCEPRVGRMLLEAHQRNCLTEVTIIAAALETQDVRQRPAGKQAQADEAHAAFLDPHSDFLSYLRLWDFFERLRAELGRSRLQKALNQRFLSYPGFREWAETVRQLRELLGTVGIRAEKRRFYLPPVDTAATGQDAAETSDRRHRGKHARRSAQPADRLPRPEGYDAIHQSLLAGLLSGIATRAERHEYKAAGGVNISLWPGSGLFRRQPLWIMAAEIVETTRRYGRTIAEIDVEWIEHAAGDLVKHTYSDPAWSSKTGAAIVHRRSSLYGLTIVSGRRTALAPIDLDAARDMLIEHGLVGNEWHCHEAFYRHNLEMLADMHELAQRTRSRDYILDRFHLAAFYQSRLPADVYDLATLRSFVRKHKGQPVERQLWMQSADLLAPHAAEVPVEQAFPNALQIGATELPLEYHFEPGHAADGVTLTVPQAALRQISEEALGWLVPGLLEEKLLYLIRSLPKALRTNFVPAPDVAKKLADRLASADRSQPFSAALCVLLSEHAGEPIRPDAFDLEKLPPHLKFFIRVVDDSGELVGSGRDVRELQAAYAPQAGSSTVEKSAAASTDSTQPLGEAGQDWAARIVTPADFDELPEQVMLHRGGVRVAAFPTLIDIGTSVEIRLADTFEEAERKCAGGATRLFALQHQRSLRSQVAHLPGLGPATVQLGFLVSGRDLQAQLQDLIVRIALVEKQPALRTRQDFEARNARGSVQIAMAAQEISGWLPKLAEEAHQVRLWLERAPAAWREVQDDIQHQLDQLFPIGFLSQTPWEWLREFPRYLQAIRQRVEKLTSGGLPKDRKLREPIDIALHEFRRLSAALDNQGAPPQRREQLEQLRWLIEELRVSIFAQQLGTKVSVSPKRIQSAVEQLEK